MKRGLVAIVCVALALLLPAAPLHAQSLEQIFTTANEAFFRGDFKAAAAQYQRLIDAGVQDPDVYFNAGMAHARLGELGLAALALERSLWLAPSDDSAERELTAAYATLGKGRAERAGEATLRTRPPLIEALVRPLSADTLALLVLVLNALLFGMLLWRRRESREAVRLGLTVALPLAALLLVASGIGLAVKTEWSRQGSAGLVVRENAELREGPDAHAQVRSRGYEGQGARVLQYEGAFANVELDGGQRGWMKRADIGVIRPD